MRPSPEDIIQALYDAAENGIRVVVTNGGPAPGTIELGPSSLAALEEVQVNVAGEGGLSTEATLAALLAVLTPGTPEQYVGTIGVAPQTVTFSGPTKQVTVSNPTKDKTFEVSFDGGASYMQLTGVSILSLPCRVTGLRLRSISDVLPYGIIASV
ncbi:MAG: hypothetical protein ACYS9X_11730 [Planctomycetota bacterium]